jgi:hypothetical protein
MNLSLLYCICRYCHLETATLYLQEKFLEIENKHHLAKTILQYANLNRKWSKNGFSCKNNTKYDKLCKDFFESAYLFNLLFSLQQSQRRCFLTLGKNWRCPWMYNPEIIGTVKLTYSSYGLANFSISCMTLCPNFFPYMIMWFKCLYVTIILFIYIVIQQLFRNCNI